jgi:hypothetical protein
LAERLLADGEFPGLVAGNPKHVQLARARLWNLCKFGSRGVFLGETHGRFWQCRWSQWLEFKKAVTAAGRNQPLVDEEETPREQARRHRQNLKDLRAMGVNVPDPDSP